MEFVTNTETSTDITSVNFVDRWGDLAVLCMCPNVRAAEIIVNSLKVVFAAEDENLLAEIRDYAHIKEVDSNSSQTCEESSEDPPEDSASTEETEEQLAESA